VGIIFLIALGKLSYEKPSIPCCIISMEVIFNLGLALALGLLVGVERGWQEREAAEGSRLAGIRTFGLISLLGGLWDLLSRGSGEILLGIAFLGFVVLMAVAHVAEARAVTITASPP
jgi:uncharacterized membrane protein YhiD involved in acid resistance